MAGIPGSRSPRVMLHKFQKKSEKSRERTRQGFITGVPSIHSSPLKKLFFLDTVRLDEFFDHTGIRPGHHKEGKRLYLKSVFSDINTQSSRGRFFLKFM
jgi:hypothetical protein